MVISMAEEEKGTPVEAAMMSLLRDKVWAAEQGLSEEELAAKFSDLMAELGVGAYTSQLNLTLLSSK